MTAGAGGWSFRELLVGLVACGTGDRFMSARQLEVCIIVIKCRTIQDGDICSPTDMIGVACFTSGFGDFRTASMKSFASIDISIDFFVAITAKPGLCALFKAYVAAGALALVFGVSLYNFAWHQQSFDISGVSNVHK
jgi:hypothetical protein